MSDFSAKLKKYRQSRHDSQEVFAEFLETPIASYNRYERGEVPPSWDFLSKLIEHCGAEAFHLMPGAHLAPKPTPVTGVLPEHVEAAYTSLCEVLDGIKATPADVPRKAFARILGKAAREFALAPSPEAARAEVLRDAEIFRELLK